MKQIFPEFDFTRKLRHPDVLRRLREYQRTGTTCAPIIVELDPTTACNCFCPECISAGLLNKGQMPPERIDALISELHEAGVLGVIFIGGGEPLAHTGMPTPIVLCHELGMAVGLTTNGTLLHRHIGSLSSILQWTRVSVDAATPSTFDLFRPSGVRDAFRRVIDNLESWSAVATGTVGFSFLLMERGDGTTNCDELLQATMLARDVGCDYFEVKPAVDQHHHLIALSERTRRITLEQLALARELETPQFRVVFPTSLVRVLSDTPLGQPKGYTRCATLQLRTVITPSAAYPCPYKRGQERASLGPVDRPFRAWWLSEERRERAAGIDPSTECGFYCIRHELNLAIEKGVVDDLAGAVEPAAAGGELDVFL